MPSAFKKVAADMVPNTPSTHQAAGSTVFWTFGTYQVTGSTGFNKPDIYQVAKGDVIG